MSVRGWRPRAVVVASALGMLAAVTAVVGMPPADATGGTSRAQADFALDAFGDPWDFANPEDLELTPSVGTLGVANARIEDGTLRGDASPGGVVILASTFGQVLPWGRDTLFTPIDAGRYKVLSFRLRVDQASAGGVFWYPCANALNCQGGQPISIQPGWNDYSITLAAEPTFGPQPWAGTIRHLRLAFSGSQATSFELDWVRLHEPGVDPVLLQGAAGAPQPRLSNPDRAGGVDYATVVRGDPWDFNQASDVGQVNQVDLRVANGQVEGTNLSNDGWFALPLGAPIDGSRFHRLTFTATYSGAFSLADACGGGMNARLVWQVAGQPAAQYQDSQDIVVLPGRRTYTVELATNPPSDAADESVSPRLGWAGQQITYLRFDPHEDRCARAFQIEDVRIAEDDQSAAGTAIVVEDGAWEPGTVADIVADTDRNGCDGTTVRADVPIQAGVNQLAWIGGVPAGTYWICVRLRDATYTSTIYSSGPLRTSGGSTPPPVEPRNIDSACPPGEVPPSGFTDVAPAHARAVDCMVYRQIALGYGPGTYRGAQSVNRSQMAAFLSRLVSATGAELPPPGPAFPDTGGDRNEDAIRRLTAAGIVNGLADGSYGPGREVSRGQMATFLVRTAGFLGLALPAGADRFFDDDTSVHEANINAVAAEGVAAGTATPGAFAPDAPVRRDQMASFLARLLALLTDEGYVTT